MDGLCKDAMKILHVTGQNDWKEALEKGVYRADTLEAQGFIHCCLPDQLDMVLKEWFAGKEDLVLVEIETSRLASMLKFEQPAGGKGEFPHIYGPINLEAVIGVRLLKDN